MTLTPLDMLHKEFRKSLRGLREREVQEFLQEAAQSLEEALATNADLRDKVQSLERRLLHYEKIEETMQNALVLAQRSAEENVLASQKKAEGIVAEAELRRKEILADARERGAEIEREYAELRQQRELFETEFRALLTGHLETLSTRSAASAAEPTAPPEEEPSPRGLLADLDDEGPEGALDWARLEPDSGDRNDDEHAALSSSTLSESLLGRPAEKELW